MRIVFIITDYGSFNNFLGELSIQLVRQGHKVYVFTANEKVINIADKYDYEKMGICFRFVNFPRSFNFYAHYKVSKAIQRKIHEIHPDIVSIHFTTAVFSTLLSGRLPYKTIGTFHGLGYPVITSFLKRGIFKAVELFSCYSLDEIWVLNKVDYILLQPRFKDKVFLLPTKGLGCDLSIFDIHNYPLQTIQNSKEALGIKPEDFVITYTGRYVNFKGFDLVVRAFKMIEDNYPEVKVKLITMGGLDKIHNTGLTKAEEQYFNMSKSVLNIGFTRNVADYLALTDIFVFPSMKEGVPVCIIESLAMNIPVITLDARGCNDLVQNNINGFLLNKQASYTDIAEKILELYHNKKLLGTFKENIRIERALLARDKFIEYQLAYFNNV